jgi:hypothetical protein
MGLVGGALVVGALGAAACGDGDAGGTAEAALPDCAAAVPVPAAHDLVEVTATPSAENPTCAVTLATGSELDGLVQAWERSLESAGVRYQAQVVTGRQAVLRMQGPVCGSVIAFAPGEQTGAAVAEDRSTVLVSVLGCDDPLFGVDPE